MSNLDTYHDLALARFGLKERTAPYRGEPPQVNRRPGPRKGYDSNAAPNVGPIKVALPLTKAGLRAGLARFRG